MKQLSLDKQQLKELVELSEQLDKKLKEFSNQSEKVATKWQLWAETKRNKIQKHKD